MGLSAVYTDAGDPVGVVKLIDVDEPRDPGPGQVLIRVTLFPITANWRPPRRITARGGPYRHHDWLASTATPHQSGQASPLPPEPRRSPSPACPR